LSFVREHIGALTLSRESVSVSRRKRKRKRKSIPAYTIPPFVASTKAWLFYFYFFFEREVACRSVSIHFFL